MKETIDKRNWKLELLELGSRIDKRTNSQNKEYYTKMHHWLQVANPIGRFYEEFANANSVNIKVHYYSYTLDVFIECQDRSLFVKVEPLEEKNGNNISLWVNLVGLDLINENQSDTLYEPMLDGDRMRLNDYAKAIRSFQSELGYRYDEDPFSIVERAITHEKFNLLKEEELLTHDPFFDEYFFFYFINEELKRRTFSLDLFYWNEESPYVYDDGEIKVEGDHEVSINISLNDEETQCYSNNDLCLWEIYKECRKKFNPIESKNAIMKLINDSLRHDYYCLVNSPIRKMFPVDYEQEVY